MIDTITRTAWSSRTSVGTALLLTEIIDLRAELRQDLAALGDELAGLRRHMNEHLTAIRSELLRGQRKFRRRKMH
ncbi:hypothetical protein [Nonomuraea candida]|uniref:hypothetical protein n=1 Tax=Nonomuraea candida TaxID=359159 RepID=UPI0005B836B8|nr:hypothetical protein [Nonomuraea candida]